MKNEIKFLMLLFIGVVISSYTMGQDKSVKPYGEAFRPQVHFSPKEKWMNDPNGMVYYKGVYHLFFQYYPDDIVWGPMHWGHAESKDLVHWKQLPIALYPDSLGYIFSGSAVVDYQNTSGFGKNGQVPMVAIFTHHDPKGEKAGVDNFQNESIAYSLDEGKTWTKYTGNPVLKNPGIKDFRDPKVSWFAAEHKWIMTLATKDRVTFFSSLNLKDWKKESDFGATVGAHGGVWECPDLFLLKMGEKTYWVLLVSINPGGTNGGSATQYFIGNFDGKTFTPNSTDTKWIDYGPDDYAGITWSNTGSRKLFLGWMSNWLYANQVPTAVWRNAMTIPRELRLEKHKDNIFIASSPAKEINSLKSNTIALKNVKVHHDVNLTPKLGKVTGQYILKLNADQVKNYSIVLSNDAGEKLIIGYNKTDNQYYIDRTQSGNVAFEKDFAKLNVAPRLSSKKGMTLELVVDASSVELFADGGLTVMTSIFFPTKPYNKIHILADGDFLIKDLSYSNLRSIW